MSKVASYLSAIPVILLPLFPLIGQADSSTKPSQENSTAKQPFTAFTGKVTKNKVRMRLLPNLESSILREFNREDLIIVVGESEDFYAILPPKDLKSYIFRTFVLDNVIEGSRVNVRLEPNLDSPVIAQLNSGDHIEGNVSALNSKWIEIAPPESTRFYVSKEYVEKIGDASMLETLTKRKEEVNRILTSTALTSQAELQKAYPQININSMTDNLNKIIKQYPEFSHEVAKAKEMLKSIQDAYLQKKIAYLEAREHTLTEKLNSSDAGLPEPTQAPQTSVVTARMNAWIPAEEIVYKTWKEDHPNSTLEEFYQWDAQNATTLKGTLEVYNRSVKNKPGDYLLINPLSRLPIGYLYSTKINLQDKVGQEVTLIATERPNNDFAFPAYFVLSVE
jgi:hypothetical protein